MKKLTILSVNFNTSDFLNISLYALQKLTENDYCVNIIDTGSTKKDFKNLNHIARLYKNITIKRINFGLTGSLAHGTALNYLTKNITTPYFVILDSDAVFLKKSWDNILIKRINGKTKIIGTQAPPQKPQDFPLMFAALFETKTFKELHLDFTPKNIKNGQDTGFELRNKYLSSDFQGEIIKFFNTRTFKEGPFSQLNCVAEYYLNGYKEIFASHFGRGSTLGRSKYLHEKKLKYRIPLIKELFLKKIGTSEKNTWLKICQKIIDTQ
jgi:hypothetical protein